MRSILCPGCASNFNLHPADVSDGFKMRKVEIKVKTPTDGSHKIVVTTGAGVVSETPVPMIVCDHCNDKIVDGTPGVCVSIWRGDEEPVNWEENYTA